MNNYCQEHTFVICAYKKSLYLEDCILSLEAQTVSTNIILYTSTPSSFLDTIGRKYNIPIYTQTGGSIGKDWNNALSFVKTKYATIAHQDDVYDDTYVEKVINEFKKDSGCLIAYPDYSEWKNGEIIPKNVNLKIKHAMLATMNIFPRSKFWRKCILAFGNPISCPAVSYNLEILKDFKFNESMRVSLDWLAWYQINQYDGSFHFVDEQLMFHRIHEESETSNTISDNTRTNEDLLMYQKFWPKPIAHLLMRFYKKSQMTNE
ncbi:glycosyltransferase family A protein [Enterococcus sp. AZ109]|uniref:glycosyltransferase family A protein n=1 Tax=Enterococcus sp. AZ109 TaxID=2774634 RepID=UPI003F280C7B